MKNTPLVSAIIPVYNCERYVKEAIDSILAQTYRPIEIIVINDGSTDGSEAAANQFGSSIRYYDQQNKGLGATRNRGVELAEGHFVAFLDADDLWDKNKIEQQMKAFNEDPNLDMAFSYVQQFYAPELETELRKKITYKEEIMKGYIASTLMIKRASIFKAGKFETDWIIGEFLDWYMKAKEKRLTSVVISEVLAKRRIHDSNMGTRERHHRSDYVRIVKASLERRRGLANNRDISSLDS